MPEPFLVPILDKVLLWVRTTGVGLSNTLLVEVWEKKDDQKNRANENIFAFQLHEMY